MDLASIIESLLVASESPLPTSELARLIRSRATEFTDDAITEESEERPQPEGAEAELDMVKLALTTDEEVEAAITTLNKSYDENGRSFTLAQRSNKGWKLYTRAEFGGFVGGLFPGRKPERLSAPAMETLAITAYRQPITKSALEAVRGVSCDGMLQKLLDRELVRIEGRADLPGRPLLYATTDLFLEHFGIADIEELPNIGELRKVELPSGEEEAPEGENEDENKAQATEAAETQLALSAVEKPANSSDSEEDTPAEESSDEGDKEE